MTATQKDAKKECKPTSIAIERLQEMHDNGEPLPDYAKVSKYTGKVYIGGGNKRQANKEITTVMIGKDVKERMINDIARDEGVKKTVEGALLTMVEYWEEKHAEEKAIQEKKAREKLERELRKKITAELEEGKNRK